MLLCSVKIKKHTVTLVSLLCAAVFVLICFFSLKLSPADNLTVGDSAVSLSAEDEEDIKGFLSSLGYEPEELLSERDIIIPAEWNGFYSSYAETQKAQGFDLSKIKGKAAQEYTFSLLNSDRFAVILVCEGRICAAHLSRMDGSKETEALIK